MPFCPQVTFFYLLLNWPSTTPSTSYGLSTFSGRSCMPTLLHTQKARHSRQTTYLTPTPPIYKPITLPLYHVHILLPILRPPLYIDCLETRLFRSPQIISMRRHHQTLLPFQLSTSHQLHRFLVNPPIRLRQPQQLT